MDKKDGTGLNGAVPLVDRKEKNEVEIDWIGKVSMDGTGSEGAVPLVVSKEKNEKNRNIEINEVDKYLHSERNRKENLDGTGLNGAVPTVVSFERNEAEIRKVGKDKMDGTGLEGAVPLVGSKVKSEKKRNGETTTDRDKQPIVTNNHNENIKGGNKGAVPVEKKRKVGVIEDEVQVESKESIPVKYIGETSRSAYERLREHYRDRENISVKSHMMKHYIEKHRNIRLE